MVTCTTPFRCQGVPPVEGGILQGGGVPSTGVEFAAIRLWGNFDVSENLFGFFCAEGALELIS